MTLTSNPDTDAYLIKFFKPKNLIYFGMISKEARNMVRACPIYLELKAFRVTDSMAPQIINSVIP